MPTITTLFAQTVLPCQRKEVLNDLQFGGLVFRSVKLMNARVRLVGSVAVLTGESKTIAERQGIVSESHFRLIAVYVEAEGSIRLLHFQSTDTSVITLKPAIRYQFKSGQRDWPET
jgi:hypothetical protein